MKRKITLLLLAAGSLFKMNSQVMLQENFTATFVPTANNWDVQNLSQPIGSTSWFQGSGAATFPAFNGSPNDYFAANYNSQGTTAGGISNWLITPSLTIYNGAVIEFATRVANTGTALPFPDRLQLRMSPNATNSVIPTGTASVGTFTTLLLDINPLLSTNTTSAVVNGSVNGYPQAWTVYSVQISGVTGTVTGRFAFRYFVDDGGVNGTNSSYVGIDAVKYTLPCLPTIQSYTTCAGASTTLQAVGLPATTYSWNTNATTSSIIVSPSGTTIYTLYPSNGATSCGTSVTATVTVGSQLAIGVSASSTSICSGQTVTLTATSAASSYTWGIGTTPIGATPVITVQPTSSTTYSIAAQNGISCFGLNSILITVNTTPTVSYATNPNPICLGTTAMTITASGATTYSFVLSNTVITTNPLTTVAVPTATGVYQLGVFGSSNGCIAGGTATFAVNSNPTVAVSSSTNNACTNSTVNITASGAAGYSWTGAATSTNNPLTFTTGATAGTSIFTVVGTNSAGCTHTATFSQAVVVCNTSTGTTVGLMNVSGYEETAIFPNPFANEIKINVLDGHVVIYNAIGQAVITTPVRSSEIINTTELPKGAYLVKAFNSNGEVVKTVKLIKN